jgi:hypothetical protein
LYDEIGIMKFNLQPRISDAALRKLETTLVAERTKMTRGMAIRNYGGRND